MDIFFFDELYKKKSCPAPAAPSNVEIRKSELVSSICEVERSARGGRLMAIGTQWLPEFFDDDFLMMIF